MTLLNPMAIAIAAAITIPPLIALYFLKLKRVERPVPSTLLWRRSVEDLQVNSPFQRLRRSLLLLLQCLVLVAAALALGKPMLRAAERYGGTVILLIDQSASMSVTESHGQTRLDAAKEQAKRCVDNMGEHARAMVIAFCDRAAVVSSFDTDKQALKRKIDSIEQTHSSSSLIEAVHLAEAYAQDMIIGREGEPDVEIRSDAPPASVFLFTDGRIHDADRAGLSRLNVARMQVVQVGARGDNVGIVAMDARRNYERPERLEVAATVENFGPEPRTLDVVLYVAGQNVDVQSLTLQPAPSSPGGVALPDASAAPGGRRRVIAFDEIDFAGGGVVEVVLHLDDALSADDRAWVVIDPPRHLRVLLVTDGNLFLQNVLAILPLDLVRMTPQQYESAKDEELVEVERSAFDVVILDGHPTSRLPRGNYFFFGAVPRIEGVDVTGIVKEQVIFNWDDTHPILRHVAVETLYVFEWLELELPPEAVLLMEGETSAVMAYMTRDASQYLISAFGLIGKDQNGYPIMNTYWVTNVDFVVFMQNAIQYLAGSVAAAGKKSIGPGDTATLPLPPRAEQIVVRRPDGMVEHIASAGASNLHYARTRTVGVYQIEPGLEGLDAFAVSLLDPAESDVRPAAASNIGSAVAGVQAGSIEASRPAWPYLIMVLLVLLLCEWVVYNRRVLM